MPLSNTESATRMPDGAYVNVVGDLVYSKFDQALRYADTAFELYKELHHKLIGLATAYNATPINVNTELPPLDIDYTLQTDKPTDVNIEYTIPNAVTPVTLKDEVYPVNQIAPVFNVSTPTIETVTKPTITDPEEVASPTLKEVPSDITPPVLSENVMPTLHEIRLPDPVRLANLHYTKSIPSFNVTPPSATFIYDKQKYSSMLGDALDAKILSVIVSGGTGLDPVVENAIWERGRNRLDYDRGVRYTEAQNYWASRGFNLPPGAIAARCETIDREYNLALLDLNASIVTKQAELTWESLKSAITTGVERENSLMATANAEAQRVFDASKTAYEGAISLYKAKIEKYNASLLAYKTEADVFITQVQAENLKVEAYKAQLEGAKIETETQQAQIDIANSKLQYNQLKISLYNAQLQSSIIKTEINKGELEVYRLQIEAYKAKFGIITAKYQAYQAELAGEESKVKLYSSQVAAFSAQVDAYSKDVEKSATEYSAQAGYNKDLTVKYQSDVERYKADMQAELGKMEGLAKKYAVEGELYNSSSRVTVADAQLKMDKHKQETQLRIAKAEIEAKEQMANFEQSIKLFETEMAELQACLQSDSQIMASSLSSVNASAALGFDGGYNSSYSTDKTLEKYDGVTTNNQHIWHEG